MGMVRMGPPSELVLKLKKQLAITRFIETGTLFGNTARWAANHFQHVATIENSPGLYQAAKEKCAPFDNIEVIYGHSKEKLGEILAVHTSPAIFWLDAHWSGGATYGERDECPLIEEIAVIQRAGREHVILIDDARLFVAPPPLPHNADAWPNIAEIVKALDGVGDGRRYHVIFEDVIISVPATARNVVIDYVRSVGQRDGYWGRLMRKLGLCR